MATPLPSQGFVAEASYQPDPSGAGYSHDVLPFLVTFEDINWESIELLGDSPVLKDLPHSFY
ncbi:MAG: hypothetical protein V3U43_07315, partial [Pseudomonadales bacterium]